GGIVGRVDSGYSASIVNCCNSGSVTSYQYAAGIVGGAFGSLEIDGCFNTGDITTISYGMTYLGGIAGCLQDGTISNCYNLGKLYNRHWSDGHVRAIGGIVGSEVGHAIGTAVSNCFNAASIDVDTSKMTPGSKFIYSVGNISGGNSKTAVNTMTYENCFYLEGSLLLQDESHPGYGLWSDVYKNNPLAYDTAYITKCTVEQMKGEVALEDGGYVLDKLGPSFVAGEAGYPVLYWEAGAVDPAPAVSNVEYLVRGGEAAVSVVSEAAAGDVVEITVSDVETGKVVKSVTVTDVSGMDVPVTMGEGVYLFTMPSRSVGVVVTLENVVAEESDAFAIDLPSDLDSIWSLRVDSTHIIEDGDSIKVSSGATVTVVVEKNEKAQTSSFEGISVTTSGVPVEGGVAEGNTRMMAGAKCYGEYTFTMPASDVEVTLNATYSELSIYSLVQGEEAALKASITREQALELADENGVGYFSGWASETQPFIGKAENYVTLEQVLEVAGLELEEGDTVAVAAPDGFSQTYTYDYLVATERSYFSDIFEMGENASEATAFEPAFTIVSNMANNAGELAALECDTLYTYRFVFGQSAAELAGKVKINDRMPQNIVSVTLVKGSPSEGVTPEPPDTSGMDLVSATWDGISVDTSWYFANREASQYTVSTAAQLAGVSALVNGLVNESCKVYTGSEVLSASEWAEKFAIKGNGSSGGENESTTSYYCGIESFD
ncbi:MAG: hypothetical protein IKV48_05845, partial [Eggerthellaceae bacterium]|nr:hypothetical protein [Eggerthellaceae bacterium]